MPSKAKTTKSRTSKKSKKAKLKWWYILPVIAIVAVVGYLIVNYSQAANDQTINYIKNNANFKFTLIDQNGDGVPNWYDKYTLTWNDLPGIQLDAPFDCVMDTGNKQYTAISFMGGISKSGDIAQFTPDKTYYGWETVSSTCYARLRWINRKNNPQIIELPPFQLPAISNGSYSPLTVVRIR